MPLLQSLGFYNYALKWKLLKFNLHPTLLHVFVPKENIKFNKVYLSIFSHIPKYGIFENIDSPKNLAQMPQ